MSSSYKQACEVLASLKDQARDLVALCDRDREFKSLPVRKDLIAFRSTILDVLVRICDKKYIAQTDINQYNADLYIIGTSATADVNILHPIISRTSSPSFSPSSLNREKLLDIGERIYKHEKDLQRILYLINGQEDWSRLSPKPPSTPTLRNKDFPKGEKKVTFTPSSSSSQSRSTRSSPSSVRATVEEVPDTGEDEADHMVSSYHLDPNEFDKSLKSEKSEKQPDLPRVVLRQATDPNTLHSPLTPIDFDDVDHMPRGLNMFGTMQIVDSPREIAVQTDEQTLTRPNLQKRSSEEILQEIRRHEEELQRMREELNSSSSNSSFTPSSRKDKSPVAKNLDDPFKFNSPNDSKAKEDLLRFKTSFESSSSSSNSQTMRSKPRSVDYGRPTNSSSSSLQVPDSQSRPQRQRAATTSSTESARRPNLNTNIDVPPPPHLSPRYSPYASSSDYPSPRARTGGFDSQNSRSSNSSRESIYGNNHNTSLPTVLEHSAQSLRNTADRGKKRASWAPDNEFNAAGDFALFDSAEPASQQPLFRQPAPPSAPSSTSPSAKELPLGSIIQDIHVTLMDLFAGSKKRVPVERMLEDSMSGQLQPFMETVDVQIYPGLRPGNRVTFSGRGDWVPHLKRYGDLAFVLVEKSHDMYEREGRDLIMRVEVSLYESLVGWTREIHTLCGETLEVSPRRATPMGMMFPIGPYGLPKFMGKNQPVGSRGEMLIKVAVKWPNASFDSKQRALLRQALGEGGRSPRP